MWVWDLVVLKVAELAISVSLIWSGAFQIDSLKYSHEFGPSFSVLFEGFQIYFAAEWQFCYLLIQQTGLMCTVLGTMPCKVIPIWNTNS